jgi:hypothetical protein
MQDTKAGREILMPVQNLVSIIIVTCTLAYMMGKSSWASPSNTLTIWQGWDDINWNSMYIYLSKVEVNSQR